MSFVYRGLKAELTRHIITDQEIDRQIERLQQQNFRIAEITDRPTEQGDEVVLDYAGYCDGVQFPGGTAQMQTLVLGSGAFIPGFEEQLLDKVPGEEVTVHVTFPEVYHSADLAGKAAEF
ncbi:MAG: FKBP-type peptidyl-prolyl cis-trans isomerase, partial [Oscillospiraceae bacterium]|nr:FKBP-type peptidyl-prolyl cis-trans isomerase [Oscillospiraceae bacterium]